MAHSKKRTARAGQGSRRLLSAEDAARLEAAQLRDIEHLQRSKLSWEEAMEQVGLVLPHSTLRTRLANLHERGVQGLMDQRRPPKPKFTEAMQGFAIGSRRLDPSMPTQDIAEKLREAFGWTGSVRRLEEVLRQAGVAHPRGGNRSSSGRGKTPEQSSAATGAPAGPTGPSASEEETDVIVEEQELGGAGLALLKLVDERTGYSLAMAHLVQQEALEASERAVPLPVDRDHRDERGRFLPEYNAPRPRTDPAVGPVFGSVEEKRQNKDFTRLSVAQVSVENIAAKILAVMALPVVSESGRFDGVTDPRGEWLESLGALPFMPETLSKFARELKYLGVSKDLIDAHADFWYRQLEPALGEKPSQIILYVDGTTKAYWTKFFHKSGPVAMVGRVMPCLESVVIHTGQGVPLFLQTFAGHVPLVKHLLPAIHKMEAAIGEGQLGRLTVVDGEMNCVDLFKQFDKDLDDRGQPRRFITPLDKSQVKDLSRIQELTSWEPHRDGDRVADGYIELTDSNDRKAPPYRTRVILLQHRGKETVAAFATNAPHPSEGPDEVEGFETRELVDIYYRRWPAQEQSFRDLKKAVDFDEVHGYGKQKVLNVTVIDQIEALTAQIERAEAKLAKQRETAEQTGLELRDVDKELRTVDRNLQRASDSELTLTISGPDGTHRLAMKNHQTVELEQRLETLERRQSRIEERADGHSAKIERLDERVESLTAERDALQERRLIYQTDVELDQILSSFKLGFALLYQVLLHQFFAGAAIELNRFIANVFALPGRRVVRMKTETYYLTGNRRNPEMMELLEQACQRINAAHHMRDGRHVRFEISWPP